MKVYSILSDAVETGVGAGIYRAYKHLDDGQHPTEADLTASIVERVMGALDLVVVLDDEDEDEHGA